MISSVKEFFSVRILLKVVVLFCGVAAIVFDSYYDYDYIINGFERSCALVIFALLVKNVFFEPSANTELFVLVAALLNMISATCTHALKGIVAGPDPQQFYIHLGIILPALLLIVVDIVLTARQMSAGSAPA